MFRIHEDSKKASAKDLSLKSLWNRPDQSCGEEWNFYRGFAIYCVSGTASAKLIEAEPPSTLSRVDLDGTLNKVPIEELLGHAKDGPHFEHPRLCAIRYLAGILELPRFWRHFPPRNSPKCERASDVLSALCDTVDLLLDDTTDTGAPVGIDSSPPMLAGQMAVDLLACSMLTGLLRLRDLDTLPQCPNKLPAIVSTLTREDMKDGFPRSFKPACDVRDLLGDSSSLGLGNADAETPAASSALDAQGYISSLLSLWEAREAALSQAEGSVRDQALGDFEAQIASNLGLILDSREALHLTLLLEGDEPQALLDVVKHASLFILRPMDHWHLFIHSL
ncbi:hypothetical protein B0H14DRAFT_49900 [Mycena olivaceomarginata]|nr:hypothetical protein B0H14DRAFT_49900 [Mycena olivaceomarginata]